MIQGRAFDGHHWSVFQHDHSGWWYTDGHGVVCRIPFNTQGEAMSAMVECKERQEHDKQG
jgi:hypothetical protein